MMGTEQRLHEHGRFGLRTGLVFFAGAGYEMLRGIHTIDYCFFFLASLLFFIFIFIIILFTIIIPIPCRKRGFFFLSLDLNPLSNCFQLADLYSFFRTIEPYGVFFFSPPISRGMGGLKICNLLAAPGVDFFFFFLSSQKSGNTLFLPVWEIPR